jgi:chemotaxis protein MotB
MLNMLDTTLLDKSGESMVFENTLKHITIKVTEKGLIIEIFDTSVGLLIDQQNRAIPGLKTLTKMMSSLFKLVKNPISIEGHIQSHPIVLQNRPGWEHSLE